jgi:cytochrome P450
MTETIADTGSAEMDLPALLGYTERDPHTTWQQRRAIAGVLPGMPQVAEMPPEIIELMAGGATVFTAYSWEAVQTILRNPQDFSSTGYDRAIGAVMGHMILAMDPPEHMGHRSLVAQAFRIKTMQDWEANFIEPLVHEMIDEFADTGHADLVEQLTFRFPVQVIAAILGLPRGDWAMFQKLSADLIGISTDVEAGINASIALRDYFADVLEARRAAPQKDLISELSAAEVDGVRLTDEEIFSFLRLLLPAGAETTFRSSSNLIYLLLTHPDQYEKLCQDRGLLPQAIEEALRFEPPLTIINRTTTRELELCGTPLPKGASLSVCMGSANRDETIRERADQFDIGRSSMEHISFATGPHTCLGMHLARAETRVVLNALMDRLPGLRLDTATDPHIEGVIFRSPPTLPVTWDVKK